MTDTTLNKVLAINNLHLEELKWNDKAIGRYVVTDGQEAYGVVSNRYKPVSHKEALSQVQEWLPEGKVTNVYTEDGFSRAVFNIELPKVYEFDGDEVKTFINLRNSLDGRWTLGLIVSPVQVICHNTFVLSFKEAYIDLETKHTATSVAKFFNEVKLVEQVYRALEGQLEVAEKLKASSVTTDKGIEFLQKLIDKKVITKKAGEQAKIVFTQPQFDNEKQRTLLGVFNATTNVLSRELETKETITAYDKLIKVGEAFTEVVS